MDFNNRDLLSVTTKRAGQGVEKGVKLFAERKNEHRNGERNARRDQRIFDGGSTIHPTQPMFYPDYHHGYYTPDGWHCPRIFQLFAVQNVSGRVR